MILCLLGLSQKTRQWAYFFLEKEKINTAKKKTGWRMALMASNQARQNQVICQAAPPSATLSV